MKTDLLAQKLLTAYENMLDRISLLLDKVDQSALTIMQEAFDEAKITAIEVDQLTREEAEMVSLYVKRDLEQASKFLRHSGKELVDWLAFDIKLAEARTWEVFLSVADKTQLAWLALQQQLPLGSEYRTGEIIGIGTLLCTHCNHQLNFYQVSRIPPCPECQKTSFVRS